MIVGERHSGRRVLMVVHQFPPLNQSGTARPFYFAKYLPEFGYTPYVVTVEPEPEERADAAPLAELDACCKIARVRPWRLVPGAGIEDAPPFGKAARAEARGSSRNLVTPETLALDNRRHSSPSPLNGQGRRGGLFNALGDLRQSVQGYMPWAYPAVVAGLREHLRRPFDLIWATGDPWTTLIAGYWLSRATGLPLIADIRDPWTYGPRYRRWSSRKAAWSRQWERRILNRADRIVYTSPLTTAIMQQRVSPGTASRMITITNGYEDTPLKPRRDVPADKFLLAYIGNLRAGYRQPDILLEALQLACRNPELARDVRLQFVGGMAGMEQAIADCGLQEQAFTIGSVSQTESKRLMRGADVLVLLQAFAGEGVDVIAGKIFEYLAAGKPILGVAPDDGGDAWLIRQSRHGIVVGVTDSRRLADGIIHYWQLWKEGRLREVIGDRDISAYSRRRLTERFADILGEVLAEHRSRAPG